jgi:hypothetical protein
MSGQYSPCYWKRFECELEKSAGARGARSRAKRRVVEQTSVPIVLTLISVIGKAGGKLPLAMM